MSSLSSANRYDLHGRNVTVTYGEAGADGTSYFNYASAEQSFVFKGSEIRVQNNDLGKIVSVSLRRTIDSGSTSFTILVPRVLMSKSTVATSVKTVGITTVHKCSILQILMKGQDDLYKTIVLSGTASIESYP